MKRSHGIRQSFGAAALLAAALFLMPLAVVTPFREEREQVHAGPETAEQIRTEAKPAAGTRDSAVWLRVLDGEKVREMDLGTYLAGVVRAEMPASFSTEALKAQATAARTYTVRKLEDGGNHGGQADLCTNPGCCQAWLDEETACANWESAADLYEEKVRRAVRETDGEVILYGGEPILAVFHSSSAGRTRGAGAVWQSDLPYLQPVDSPEGEDSVPDYYSRVELSAGTFREILLAAKPEADLSGPTSEWLKPAVTDSAGHVERISVGGVVMKGTELRSLLGLRSACFTWEARQDALIFFVTGYGHGVGMSQYGAESMALAGADYREILSHYYTGTEVGIRG